MSLRSSSLPRRALVVSGLAAALVVVPGVASADPTDPPAPLSEVTEGLQSEGDQLGGTTGGETGGETGEAPGGEGLDPGQLTALLEELGIPAECTAAFQSALESIAEGDPAALENLVTGLQEAVASQDPAVAEAALVELFGESGLAELEAALAACAPEAEEEEPPAEEEKPAPAPAAGPGQQPPAAAPVHPAPVAQKGAYLGYAPTGAGSAQADDATVPLAAVGGVVLLAGAGAAAYGMRRRAVSARG